MQSAWVKALASLLVSVLAAVSAPVQAATVTLTGEVTYRERIALPAGASLKVRLVDMTAAGTPTRVEAVATIGSPGQVPLTFTLNFDDRAVVTGNSHALVAEISAGVELWFRNNQPYAVEPTAPAGPIVIITNFIGRLAQAAEPAPAVPQTLPSILDVTWQAETIGTLKASPDYPSTIAIANDLRAGGSGGCNSYFAQATLSGSGLGFSAVGATKMACAAVIATVQEEAFFAALQATRTWRMDGDRLVFIDAGGNEVVRFAPGAR